ncbi:MAG: hypothetical protein BGO39_00850 [Chloroflexi bacterium 54-19]|nr:MAG: hypothetical protein BGO39_00850 [Chloroflexi bacterium 54-19]
MQRSNPVTFEELSRQAQAAFEPFTAMIYFASEAFAHFKALGLRGRQSYFLSRSAPLGKLPGEAVAALFYNFNPAFVKEQVNTGWAIPTATPEAVLRERDLAVTEALQRLLAPNEGEEDLRPNIEEALPLVKKAAHGLPVRGRPLFAGYAAMPWPDEPSVALWHGVNLLREFRGDGHNATLLAEGIDAVEAILLQVAFSHKLPLHFLTRSRAWDVEDVQSGEKRLTERGLLDEGGLTEKGREVRERIELNTDRLDVQPFENLGIEDSQRLIELVGALSDRIYARGGLNFGPAPKPNPA